MKITYCELIVTKPRMFWMYGNFYRKIFLDIHLYYFIQSSSRLSSSYLLQWLASTNYLFFILSTSLHNVWKIPCIVEKQQSSKIVTSRCNATKFWPFSKKANNPHFGQILTCRSNVSKIRLFLQNADNGSFSYGYTFLNLMLCLICANC